MEATQIRDVFGRLLQDLRISVTDRCNFRCTYCMPAEIFGEAYEFLPREQLLTFEEITRLARIFAKLGVTKLRLTGGEPLLRRELPVLVAMLTAIDGIEDIALTTNGFLLSQQARALKQAGLKRVTVSLDSLDDAVFGRMNGRNFTVARVLEGIEAAEEAGLGPIKINGVIEKGVNDHTAVEMARYFKDTGRVVRFIEFMDVGTINGWRLERVLPSHELRDRIHAELSIEPVDKNYQGEVADRYRYLDGSGEMGFISSVSEPFCADCSRARLSSEGKLYTCLFSSDGRDLRHSLRDGASDQEIEEVITGVWRARTDRYSEERTEETAALGQTRGAKVEMYHIGG